VTCDPTRNGPAVLGRSLNPRTDIYSTCCAIQNLLFAARPEGLGSGWVSILSEVGLKKLLRIPDHVIVVGYLCLGYPERFETKPELETVGWLRRLPIREVVFNETWNDGVGVE
jgi:5,6-dimethylbenzimidazole synthase